MSCPICQQSEYVRSCSCNEHDQFICRHGHRWHLNNNRIVFGQLGHDKFGRYTTRRDKYRHREICPYMNGDMPCYGEVINRILRPNRTTRRERYACSVGHQWEKKNQTIYPIVITDPKAYQLKFPPEIAPSSVKPVEKIGPEKSYWSNVVSGSLALLAGGLFLAGWQNNSTWSIAAGTGAAFLLGLY